MPLMEDDNADGCDEFFLSAPIDNVDVTKGLSELTSWKAKGRYVVEPLNKVNSTYEKGSLSANKVVPTETSFEQAETPIRKVKLRLSVHKSAEKLVDQKHKQNARYHKNKKKESISGDLKTLTAFIKKKTTNPTTYVSSNLNSKIISRTQYSVRQVSKTKGFQKQAFSKPAKPLANTKPKFAPKSKISKPANTSKDVKGKEKVVLESNTTLQQSKTLAKGAKEG